ELERRLSSIASLQAEEPAVQFSLQSARRQLGQFDKAREWYNNFQIAHPTGPWHDAALAETWLYRRLGLPAKPVAYCRYTTTRPYLDAKFDDACWQDNKPLVLKSTGDDTLKSYPTEVRVSFDKDFLYLALDCKHPADRYVSPVNKRQQDADLRQLDHVS